MAKGNDGNLLQHGIEAELFRRVYEAGGRRGLHVIFTHGMAPFESCDRTVTGQHKGLDLCLDIANGWELPSQPPWVLRAYRECRAAKTSYPNSGEIAAALIGRPNLTGIISEVNPAKYGRLYFTWAGTEVQVLHRSWRASLSEFAPPPSAPPWVVSMDPMTYTTTEPADDDKLRPDDLARVSELLRPYINGGSPGAAAIFCFGMADGIRDHFARDVERVILTNHLSVKGSIYSVLDRGGNWHLGLVLSPSSVLLDQVDEAWAKLLRVARIKSPGETVRLAAREVEVSTSGTVAEPGDPDENRTGPG